MSFSVHEVGVQIGRKVLLDNVSFAIEPGEVVVVLGPNGAGKSSLLKVMAGELKPDSGSVMLNGVARGDWRPDTVARMVGVLPQSSSLAFPFTAAEVVMLGRLPHNTGRVRDREIVDLALQQADVSHLKQASYPSLSGGERQRVQLARVLAQIWDAADSVPRYLLLDEPTSALDVAHQQLTLQLARELADTGVGVMAILHDLNLAAQYADRVVLLEAGCVAAAGGVEEILQPDRIQALFNIDVSVMSHPRSGRPLIVTL